MSDASSHGTPPSSLPSVEEVRQRRWDDARSDVPGNYDSDELLRSIAADARRTRDAATSSMWALYVVAVCAVVGAVVALLVAFGGVTVTISAG